MGRGLLKNSLAKKMKVGMRAPKASEEMIYVLFLQTGRNANGTKMKGIISPRPKPLNPLMALSHAGV